MVFGDMSFYEEDKEAVDSVSGMNFDEIYGEYASLVYRIILYHSEDRNVAEEIMQEVFMKLYINRENIKTEAIRAWLVTTAKNMTRNYKRDSWYETAVLETFDDNSELLASDFEEDEGYIEDYGDDDFESDSLEDDFIAALRKSECNVLMETVFEDLYKKSVRWYEAVTIAYLLEKPQKEVAKIMGMSLEQLHGMLYRARKWIQERYKEEYDRLRNT